MYKDIISDGNYNFMKKYILIIFLLFTFFAGAKISYAEEAVFSSAENLNNISYLKYDGVYYHFRNQKAIRNVNTGNIAYCIEPFATLIDGSSYSGYIEYDSIFNLTEEKWNRLKLLSYYGYGYGNHYEEKWISITQMLIWRTVDPVHSFNWIDNVTDKNIIYPYQNEINELEKLVKEHTLLPSFSYDIKMSTNSIKELSDSNLVLDNFIITESDIDAEIIDNKLVIKSSSSGNKKIVLKKKSDTSYSSTFFYKSGTQSIIERGFIDTVSFEININVESGSIKIIKVDSDNESINPKGEASLIGATYSVFDSLNNLVGNIVIDENSEGYLDNLPYGKYTIKEEKAGTGYYVDKKEYSVDINSDNLDIEIILKNKVMESKLKIVKYFGNKEEYDSNSMKLESGIRFDFYDSGGNFLFSKITDDEGKIETLLPYGKYIIKQINSTTDYEKVDDIEVVVDENSNVSIDLVLYDLKVDVPDAYIEEGSKLYDGILLFILAILVGAIYVVEDY